MILFFDIETRARPEAVEHLPQPEAPANYKDAAKIAAYIAEKRAAQLADAALDPDTARVSSIAWQVGPEAAPQVQIIAPDGAECEPPISGVTRLTATSDAVDFAECVVLQRFWEAFAESDGRACGYHILGFDFPFLLRRSFALGLRLPCVPCLARYQIEPITDLYGLLYNWQPGQSLKTVARLYGLHDALPESDGAQVVAMDWRTEAAHVANDVALTAQLWERMDGIYWAQSH